MNRQDVTFDSGGVECVAWYYVSGGSHGRPCVVMAHGAMGTRDSGLEPYAIAFAGAGWDVLLFDFRHLGGSGGDPRQLVSLRRQRADYRAAVAHARSLPGVDADRVVVWGTSYTDGHALAVAATDSRILGVMAQAPAVDGVAEVASVLRRDGLVHLTRLVGHGLVDAVARRTGRPAHLLPAFGPPGKALCTAEGSELGFAAIAGPTYLNRAGASFALSTLFHRPIRKAKRVRCPALVQVVEDDDVVSPASAQRAAALMPPGTTQVRTYRMGRHFDIYVEPGRQLAIADQLEFLQSLNKENG